MSLTVDRVLIHVNDGLREVVDPADVFFLEAVRDETRIRRRGARALLDVRPIRDVVRVFESHGFLQIHRSHAVNLHRIRQLRRRGKGRDWEVKLEPPVNRVLPISREEYPRLMAALQGNPRARSAAR
jgi:DNA-binding LytR/AlgR family response regulator